MSYDLRAAIAHEDLARNVAVAFGSGSSAVRLAQGFALVPYTDHVHERLLESAVGDPATFTPFCWLSTTAAQLLRDLSRTGALAYVEAEYFGGIGMQLAVVWREGAIAYGPAGTSDETPATPGGDSPISGALRCLGVARTGAASDEFAALGLGRHRDLDDWLNAPRVERE